MNKVAIRKFAVQARMQLIEDIKQKAYELGIAKNEIKEPELFEGGFRVNQRIFKTFELKQREELITKINHQGFDHVIEEVAYTWFNRLIALRFMEVNDYLPTGVRVLTSEHDGKQEPDILTDALELDLELDHELIYQLLDTNETEDLYKYLLIKQCNALHSILPVMFERINDYTELLLPLNLLQEGSVIHLLVTSIPEEDWKEQVEIIGWLYQFYISEKKDEVFAGLKKNKKITKENIPAATQLFTPKWIVQYMVENSLGRFWLNSHPGDELKEGWIYYIEDAQQNSEVQHELTQLVDARLNPEMITIIDPCMGSGHILVYAFDVLYQIYTKAGYSPREIPKLIIEKNLYGIDIDDRAAQLAYFAIMMKARSYHRRFFSEPVRVNLISIQESNDIPPEAIDLMIEDNDHLREDIEYVFALFKDAKEYGSILIANDIQTEAIEQRLYELQSSDPSNLFTAQYLDVLLDKLPVLLKQAKILNQKYDIAITNPPYMGRSGINKTLLNYIKTNYPMTKDDMSTVFMEVCYTLSKKNGFVSLINIPTWMYLSSYLELRKMLLKEVTIVNLLHFGRGIFGSDFGTTAFVLQKSIIDGYEATYQRLFEKKSSVESLEVKREKFLNRVGTYVNEQKNFSIIPNSPIAYNMTNGFIFAYEKGTPLGQVSSPRQGLATGNNDFFLRFWYEVDFREIGLHYKNTESFLNSGLRYAPYNKGGSYRKWFGNIENVIKFDNDHYDKLATVGNHLPSRSFYFQDCLTWSKVTIGGFSMRYNDIGTPFDVAGCSIFFQEEDPLFILGLMNSNVAKTVLSFLSPTVNYEVGHVKSIPVISTDESTISNLVQECIEISKNDWNSFEKTWEFKEHPFLEHKGICDTIEDAFDAWSYYTKQQFTKMKENEQKINELFIDLYQLNGDVTPHALDEDITLSKANYERDIKSFISYAVGCMFGRYSLDENGLVCAGGEFDPERYKRFNPTESNVIPLTDEIYFDDDIVTRFVEFLVATFGEEKLEENLEFITGAINRKATESTRQALRRYFQKDFFKDHIKTYNKRPIYWLFDSGKHQGFKALIYMHRYDESLVARVRTDYLHKLQRKYEAETEQLYIILEGDGTVLEKGEAKKRKETIEKQLIEIQQYDQVIAHIANKRVVIAPDDGVKVNYAKFQEVEVPQSDGKQLKKLNVLADI
ncbi:BREX-1 system adenine-specific DNA-methyltransferase PglX [Alkalihalobacterium alkalinitrilicum]|uniref:BREX-1 system adenine-specific DNA-methyltransferase PglX n=1 Tax=Alkalihalobacterium alkalinitrilicum TaxID=427920 RepID=UPI000994DD0E|nr:BREX-1 system adenine-specific DNA-methyltransferase PglX [Alkalihalobacterium alkalinitrilicum]